MLFSENGVATTEGGIKKVIDGGLESQGGACIQVNNLLDLKQVWSEIFTSEKE